MALPTPDRDEWIRELLHGEGRLPFGFVLASLVPLDELRDFARKHGISPRGYRVDRAPARLLVPLLVDPTRPEVVSDACDLLFTRLVTGRKDGTDTATKSLVPESVLRLKEQDLAQTQRDLERGQEQVSRLREKEAELRREVLVERERVARLRGEVEALRREIESPGIVDDAAVRALRREKHTLERDLESYGEFEEAQRRLLSIRAARIKECEARIAELEGLVPKGRRKRVPKPEEPPLAEEFRLPYLSVSFYKSLEGKDRRSVEKAIQAVLLFCTEGPSYPGLEVKQIEGQDLWSLRASIKLRVYFRVRDDNDVEFVAVADREDQHTTLRRLKAR